MALLLLFLTFSILVANPKKLLYRVANPARGLLDRGKKENKREGLVAPPLPPTTLLVINILILIGENKIKIT